MAIFKVFLCLSKKAWSQVATFYGFNRNIGVPELVQNGTVKEDVPTYPPFLKGIKSHSIDEILDTQKDVLEKIRFDVGDEKYQKYYFPVIKKYAAFVHLLPASEEHHHRGAGGLLFHGLSVGLNCLLFCKNKVFDGTAAPSVRVSQEWKWYLAAFVAGLLHDIGKPLSDYKVVNSNATLVWNPYSQTLIQWLESNNIDTYYLQWLQGRYRKHEAFSAFISSQVIPDTLISDLSSQNNIIIQSMFGCISRQVSYDNALFEIVEKADHASTEIDIKKTKLTTDDVNLSIPLESYILDAICFLESSNNWGKDFINRKALIFIDDSLFITTRAINRLSERLEEMKVPGVPWHINDIIEAMLTHGLAEKYLMPTGVERNTWHLLDKEEQKIVTTVKFTEWSAVYRVIPDDDSEAYSIYTEQESKENRSTSSIKDKDTSVYGENQLAVVANTESSKVVEQESTQQPLMQKPKETKQQSQREEAKSKASTKPNNQPEHQNSLEKDLGADYQKILDLFISIFKSPSVIKKDTDIIIQWNALPDQIKKNKEVVNLLKKHKLIVQNPSGVTHIIDEQACLVLNKSERVNEILNVIGANKYLINTNKKTEDDNKSNKQGDKTKSNPATPAFMDWLSKNMGTIKVNSNGETVCNMSQVPKKFHSVKLLKEMAGDGLILLDSNDIPRRAEIEKMELIFNETLVSEIETKRGEGTHTESTLKNSQEEIPQEPDKQSTNVNQPQRIPKKTKEAITHIDVPEDFDPLSNVTNNATQHSNKKDSSRQNMLTDPIIGAIYASNAKLTPLLDSYIRDEIDTVDLIQGCEAIGLLKEDLRIIRKAIDSYAR